MTLVDPDVRSLLPHAPEDPAVDRIARMCPYLAAADGAWRSASVAREHRCGAVAPPAPLAAEKQRRLCLTDRHPTCATFEAARTARRIGPERAATLPRPLARTTPVVLDHGRLAIAVPALQADRSTGQAILIVLMALAFAAIVVAKLSGPGAPAHVVSPSTQASAGLPSAGAGSGSTVAPSATASTDPGASATATPGSGASASPGSSASPSAGQTYKVKAGDTLIGIAARFGTTSKAIATLNGMKPGQTLKIGQVIRIP